MREPVRHHYIPQFILRNFCIRHSNHLYYMDVCTREVSVQNTRDVFEVKNLYRDEINCGDYPTKIEADLARFESEAAQIIKGKFLREQEIVI